MAKALQCPSCGAKTRLDAVPGGGVVQCSSCGQAMKVPPGFGRRRGKARDAAAASSGDGSSQAAVAPPPPPRRARARGAAAAAAAPVATAAGGAGGTAVLSGPARPPQRPSAPPMPASPPAGRADGREPRDALPLVVRVVAWVLALPLGLAIVGIPARQLGYLSSQKLLDVIVKRGIDRFVPVLVIVALWALVTAVLVTIFVEGGRRLMLRRRRTKAKKREARAMADPLDAPKKKRRLLGRRK